MKKLFNLIMSFCLAMTLLVIPNNLVNAAELSMSVSSSSVVIGDSVVVKVSVPDGVTATVDVAYSNNVVAFSKASVDANDNGKVVSLTIGSPFASEASITFKATTAGTATFQATVVKAGDSNGDAIEVGGVSKNVTIKNETTSESEDTKSSDYYLASLKVMNGSKAITLSPTFKYSKTSYTATVDYDVSSVVVSATRSDGKAEIVSITDNGNVKLAVGQNVIEIVVKAENGKTLTYKVTITRKEKPADTQQPNPTEDPNPTENPQPQQPDFELNGTSLYIQEEIPDAKIPVDFVEKTILLNGGKEVSGLSFEKGDLTVFYLENDSKIGNLYVYDAEDNYVYPFIKLSSEEAYVIILMPDDATAPEGYNACTLSIEGKGIVNAYQYQAAGSADLSDFYLVYCISSNGTKGWYQYDSLEGTYQRYSGMVPTAPAAPDTETPSETESASRETGDSNNENDQSTVAKFDWKEYKNIIICIAVFLAAVIVIIIINILLAKQRKDGTGEEEEDYDDYDEEEEDSKNREGEASEEDTALEEKKEEAEETEEEKMKEEKTKEDEVEFIDL